MQSSAETPDGTWFGPSPPTELIKPEPSPQLLSQGAEARVWLLHLTTEPNDTDAIAIKASISVGSGINVPKLNTLSQIPSLARRATKLICKERFPKKYRHPQLDVSLTRSRTKAEARCLIRCARAGVSVPNVLAIANWSNDGDSGAGSKEDGESTNSANQVLQTSTISSCLFLEHVDGCTVRRYLEERSNPSEADKAEDTGEPEVKRARCETESTNEHDQSQDRITTVIDVQTLLVAHTLGEFVAKMHAAGVIHGDLTTSNVMLRNPPWSSNECISTSWTPQLILIDFGLATSTNSILPSYNESGSNNKQKKQHKQQHNAEEKAVDLYVLERAFLSTHPESELLVEEVWKGYRSYYEGLDAANDVDGGKDEDKSSGQFVPVVNSVMNRLEQVRMRGRKRECFG